MNDSTKHEKPEFIIIHYETQVFYIKKGEIRTYKDLDEFAKNELVVTPTKEQQ